MLNINTFLQMYSIFKAFVCSHSFPHGITCEKCINSCAFSVRAMCQHTLKKTFHFAVTPLKAKVYSYLCFVRGNELSVRRSTASQAPEHGPMQL